MKAYAIAMSNNKTSMTGLKNLIDSSARVGNDFSIQKQEAYTAADVSKFFEKRYIEWNYPWDQPVNDFASGLVKTPYTTKNRNARIACAISHYSLWEKCVDSKQTFLILEHDALFTNKLDFDIDDTMFDILGINDPRGATRNSQKFYEKVVGSITPYLPVPSIDDITIPQGLAGNSAYIIKPSGAYKLLKLVSEYGLWPNDAIMCRQLVGPTLGVTRKFYTRVQGLQSTTTL